MKSSEPFESFSMFKSVLENLKKAHKLGEVQMNLNLRDYDSAYEEDDEKRIEGSSVKDPELKVLFKSVIKEPFCCGGTLELSSYDVITEISRLV